MAMMSCVIGRVKSVVMPSRMRRHKHQWTDRERPRDSHIDRDTDRQRETRRRREKERQDNVLTLFNPSVDFSGTLLASLPAQNSGKWHSTIFCIMNVISVLLTPVHRIWFYSHLRQLELPIHLSTLSLLPCEFFQGHELSALCSDVTDARGLKFEKGKRDHA